MTGRSLEITALAKSDLRDAASWYQSEEEGLGARFLDAVVEAFETIEGYPLVGEAVDELTRSFPTPVFPYRVYYAVDETCFEVVAVLHMSRDEQTLFGGRRRK